MKIGIFIPAFDVAKTISKVVNAFCPEVLAQVDEILVIDNCSQDGTFEVLKEISRSNTPTGQLLTIIRNEQNYGYGGSQKIAYQYFLDNGFTHFMIIHGDNQSNADTIAKNFLTELLKEPSLDIVVGSRFMPSSDIRQYSKVRTLGNHFFNFMTYALTGLHMSDSGAAIILIRTDVLRSIPFRTLTDMWQFHPQLNILIYRNKSLRRKEIPLNWEDSEATSSLNLVKYGFDLLTILFRYWVNQTIWRKSAEHIFQSDAAEFNPVFKKYPKTV